MGKQFIPGSTLPETTEEEVRVNGGYMDPHENYFFGSNGRIKLLGTERKGLGHILAEPGVIDELMESYSPEQWLEWHQEGHAHKSNLGCPFCAEKVRSDADCLECFRLGHLCKECRGDNQPLTAAEWESVKAKSARAIDEKLRIFTDAEWSAIVERSLDSEAERTCEPLFMSGRYDFDSKRRFSRQSRWNNSLRKSPEQLKTGCDKFGNEDENAREPRFHCCSGKRPIRHEEQRMTAEEKIQQHRILQMVIALAHERPRVFEELKRQRLLGNPVVIKTLFQFEELEQQLAELEHWLKEPEARPNAFAVFDHQEGGFLPSIPKSVRTTGYTPIIWGRFGVEEKAVLGFQDHLELGRQFFERLFLPIEEANA